MRGYPLDARSPPPGYVVGMANPYGIELDDDTLRWAAAERVSETVIAAIYLLPERGVDEVVANRAGAGADHQARWTVPELLSTWNARSAQEQNRNITRNTPRNAR